MMSGGLRGRREQFQPHCVCFLQLIKDKPTTEGEADNPAADFKKSITIQQVPSGGNSMVVFQDTVAPGSRSSVIWGTITNGLHYFQVYVGLLVEN